MHAHATPDHPPQAPDAHPIPLLEDWRRSDSLDELARWTERARLVAIAAATALGTAALIAGG